MFGLNIDVAKANNYLMDSVKQSLEETLQRKYNKVVAITGIWLEILPPDGKEIMERNSLDLIFKVKDKTSFDLLKQQGFQGEIFREKWGEDQYLIRIKNNAISAIFADLTLADNHRKFLFECGVIAASPVVAPSTVIGGDAKLVAPAASDSKVAVADSKEVASARAELASLHQIKQELKDGEKQITFSEKLLREIADGRYTDSVLNLMEKRLDLGMAAGLAQALAKNKHIKMLNLANTQLGDAGMQALIRGHALDNLQALDVSGDGITAAGVQGIEKNSSLQVLLINANNSLNPEGAVCIAKNNSIRLLNIARCNIQGPGVKAFFEKSTSALVSLDASYNDVQMYGPDDSSSPTALCDSLRELRLGGSVSMSSHTIDAKQAQSGFMVHPNIRVGNRSDAINFITVRLLSKHKFLISLDLSGCELTGVVPFTQAACNRFVTSPITFVNATNLRMVDISGVTGSRVDRWLFIADLAKIPGLEVIKAVRACYVYHQDDDQKAAEQTSLKKMLAAIEASNSLIQVDVSGNYLDKETIARIAAIVKRNKEKQTAAHAGISPSASRDTFLAPPATATSAAAAAAAAPPAPAVVVSPPAQAAQNNKF
jgi:hypothetical protein